MHTFLGDYPCKLDAKGRVALPSKFRKLLLSVSEEGFIVRKNMYQKCLDLFPYSEWEKQILEIKKKVNPYNKKHSAFLREFYRGTCELTIDANGRILIPKRLASYADLRKDLVFAGQVDKIEIWNSELYESVVMNTEEYEDLANELLGSDLEFDL